MEENFAEKLICNKKAAVSSGLSKVTCEIFYTDYAVGSSTISPLGSFSLITSFVLVIETLRVSVQRLNAKSASSLEEKRRLIDFICDAFASSSVFTPELFAVRLKIPQMRDIHALPVLQEISNRRSQLRNDRQA